MGGASDPAAIAILADPSLRATREQCCDAWAACVDLPPLYRRLRHRELEQLQFLEQQRQKLEQEIASVLAASSAQSGMRGRVFDPAGEGALRPFGPTRRWLDLYFERKVALRQMLISHCYSRLHLHGGFVHFCFLIDQKRSLFGRAADQMASHSNVLIV